MEWRGREWSGGEGREEEGRAGQGRAGQGRVPDCLGGLSRVGISSRSTRPWNGQPPSNLLNIDVCLGADSLDQSNCIDYLGVKLDAHLIWNSQIDAVCKKLVFAIFRLGRLRNVIAPNCYVARLPMYYST